MLTLTLLSALAQTPPAVPASQASFPAVVDGDRGSSPSRWAAPDGTLVLWPVGTPEPAWVARQKVAIGLWKRPDGSWKEPMPASIPRGRYLDVHLERRPAPNGREYVHPHGPTLDAFMEVRNVTIRRMQAEGRRATSPRSLQDVPGAIGIVPTLYSAPAAPRSVHAAPASSPWGYAAAPSWGVQTQGADPCPEGT